MEDSIAMDDMAALRPQNFLFGCELKADKKEYTFKVDNDESEHQLSLRTISLGAVAKDDLHIVEAEGMNYEGKQLKIVLASLRQSVQPTVSLGGFEITPPVTLRLKSGSGPVYVSGQHLVALEDLGSSDEEEDDEEEEENTEATKNAKRPTTSTSKVPQKKLKLEEEEDDDDDDDEEDDDDLDDEDEEEEDDDDDEDETPVKKPAPVTKVKSAQKSNHNGKATEPSTPTKLSKTPEQKGKQEAKHQTPKTPKTPLSYEQMKERLQSTVEKGINLPKVEARFINYVKNCFRTDDKEVIDNLWNWRKTMKDLK